MKTLLPPDTTEPASVLLCEKVPHEQRGGYLHAEDDDTPYYVDGLRYCGRCHHFLDEGESHRAAPAPVATPTPDIDPEEVRRALEFFDKSEWDPEDEQREMQGNVDACCAAAREWLRLREQPAPDVQAVKLCNCGKCCPGPLYSQHELDAAVAREREAWRSKVNAAWEDYWGTSFFDDYERLEAALGALRGLTDEQIVPDVEQHRKYTADEVQKTAQSAVEMMMDREREAWIEAVIANTGKGGEWLCSPAELVAQMPTLIRARSGAKEG